MINAITKILKSCTKNIHKFIKNKTHLSLYELSIKNIINPKKKEGDEKKKIKEKIQELTEMVEMLKKQEEKQSKEKKEKNDLLKEIELLKSKCINYDKLILEKEKLAASLKEKEEEIKKLKEDAKTNNNKNEINIEQQKSEETNNNINSELQNKDDMINKLKEENEEIKEKLNNTRKKLTEIEGIYETKKLVLKKLFIKNNNLNLLYDYNYLIDRII